MKHYIEREKLVDNINALRAFTDLGIDGSFLHARVLELIDSLPVANVREVKHGTWEDSVFAPGVLSLLVLPRDLGKTIRLLPTLWDENEHKDG